MGHEEFDRLLSPFSLPRLRLGSGVTITFGGGGTGFYFLPPLPPTPSLCTDPLHRVDRSTLAFILLVLRRN